jgi:PAT family beta-lactamase induction signal transducer AmpG
VVGAGYLLALGLMLTVKFPRRPEYYARATRTALVLDTAAPTR